MARTQLISQRLNSPAAAITVFVAGLVLPWWAVTWPGVSRFQSFPAAAVPFGMNRILLVHILVAIPVSFWLSRKLSRSLRLNGSLLGVLVTAFVAVGLVNCSIQFGRAAESAVVQLSFIERFAFRTVWVILLQVPWFCLIRDQSINVVQPIPRGMSAIDLLIGLLVLVVPAPYAHRVAERHCLVIEDALNNGQIWKAWQLVDRLAVLETSNRVQGKLLKEIQEQLAGRLVAYSREIQQPLSRRASSQERLDRAYKLFSLGEFDNAEKILLDMTATDPQAAYQLARVFESQGQWRQAVELDQLALDLLRTNRQHDLSLVPKVYERLANNLRRIGRFSEARDELLEAIDQWAEYEASFHLQIGFHDQMAGRAADAIKSLRKAAEMDGRMKGIAEARIKQMQQQAEGCLLRPTQGATR